MNQFDIVFSTNDPDKYKKRKKDKKQAKNQNNQTSFPKDGWIRLTRETKGRKGSGATLIHGIPLSLYDLKDLASKLKAKIGTGGSVKNGLIEIQGDQREKLKPILESKGYKVKICGG